MKTCSVDECDLITKCKGLCNRHYLRQLRHGNTMPIGDDRFGSVYEKLISRDFTPSSECLLTNWGTTNGYGGFAFKRKLHMAHRVSYEAWHGKVPAGFHVDHTCHNEAALRGECESGRSCPHRRCVNPAHLRAVSVGENVNASGLFREFLDAPRAEGGRFAPKVRA